MVVGPVSVSLSMCLCRCLWLSVLCLSVCPCVSVRQWLFVCVSQSCSFTQHVRVHRHTRSTYTRTHNWHAHSTHAWHVHAWHVARMARIVPALAFTALALAHTALAHSGTHALARMSCPRIHTHGMFTHWHARTRMLTHACIYTCAHVYKLRVYLCLNHPY